MGRLRPRLTRCRRACRRPIALDLTSTGSDTKLRNYVGHRRVQLLVRGDRDQRGECRGARTGSLTDDQSGSYSDERVREQARRRVGTPFAIHTSMLDPSPDSPGARLSDVD